MDGKSGNNGDTGRSIIYIVRHGECVGNVMRTRRHLLPDEDYLTEKGKLQAKLLGQHLENIVFTHVVASPYIRAFSTAELILAESKASSNVEIRKDANLREKYMGIYEEGDTNQMLQDLVASGMDALEWIPEGAETKEEIERRVEAFWQEIFALVDASNNKHTILAVTHGGFLIHMCKYLPGHPEKYKLINWRPEFFKLCRNTGYFQIALGKAAEPGQPREMEIIVAHGNEHLKSLGEDTLGKYLKEEESTAAFKGCFHQ